MSKETVIGHLSEFSTLELFEGTYDPSDYIIDVSPNTNEKVIRITTDSPIGTAAIDKKTGDCFSYPANNVIVHGIITSFNGEKISEDKAKIILDVYIKEGKFVVQKPIMDNNVPFRQITAELSSDYEYGRIINRESSTIDSAREKAPTNSKKKLPISTQTGHIIKTICLRESTGVFTEEKFVIGDSEEITTNSPIVTPDNKKSGEISSYEQDGSIVVVGIESVNGHSTDLGQLKKSMQQMMERLIVIRRNEIEKSLGKIDESSIESQSVPTSDENQKHQPSSPVETVEINKSPIIKANYQTEHEFIVGIGTTFVAQNLSSSKKCEKRFFVGKIKDASKGSTAITSKNSLAKRIEGMHIGDRFYYKGTLYIITEVSITDDTIKKPEEKPKIRTTINVEPLGKLDSLHTRKNNKKSKHDRNEVIYNQYMGYTDDKRKYTATELAIMYSCSKINISQILKKKNPDYVNTRQKLSFPFTAKHPKEERLRIFSMLSLEECELFYKAHGQDIMKPVEYFLEGADFGIYNQLIANIKSFLILKENKKFKITEKEQEIYNMYMGNTEEKIRYTIFELSKMYNKTIYIIKKILSKVDKNYQMTKGEPLEKPFSKKPSYELRIAIFEVLTDDERSILTLALGSDLMNPKEHTLTSEETQKYNEVVKKIKSLLTKYYTTNRKSKNTTHRSGNEEKQRKIEMAINLYTGNNPERRKYTAKEIQNILGVSSATVYKYLGLSDSKHDEIRNAETKCPFHYAVGLNKREFIIGSLTKEEQEIYFLVHGTDLINPVEIIPDEETLRKYMLIKDKIIKMLKHKPCKTSTIRQDRNKEIYEKFCAIDGNVKRTVEQLAEEYGLKDTTIEQIISKERRKRGDYSCGSCVLYNPEYSLDLRQKVFDELDPDEQALFVKKNGDSLEFLVNIKLKGEEIKAYRRVTLKIKRLLQQYIKQELLPRKHEPTSELRDNPVFKLVYNTSSNSSNSASKVDVKEVLRSDVFLSLLRKMTYEQAEIVAFHLGIMTGTPVELKRLQEIYKDIMSSSKVITVLKEGLLLIKNTTELITEISQTAIQNIDELQLVHAHPAEKNKPE